MDTTYLYVIIISLIISIVIYILKQFFNDCGNNESNYIPNRKAFSNNNYGHRYRTTHLYDNYNSNAYYNDPIPEYHFMSSFDHNMSQFDTDNVDSRHCSNGDTGVCDPKGGDTGCCDNSRDGDTGCCDNSKDGDTGRCDNSGDDDTGCCDNSGGDDTGGCDTGGYDCGGGDDGGSYD